MKGIADTGFLVAFANRHDNHHDWAVDVAKQITEPLLTCEAVLAEAAFHLQDVKVVLSLVREGLVEVAFDCRENWPQLEAWLRGMRIAGPTWRICASCASASFTRAIASSPSIAGISECTGATSAKPFRSCARPSRNHS